MTTQDSQCPVQFGTLARVDGKARADLRPYATKGTQIDCNPGPPKFGLIFSIGEDFLTDSLTIIDHARHTYTVQGDIGSEVFKVVTAVPYAHWLGWAGSDPGKRALGHVEGECIVNGHPCVVIAAADTTDGPWARYYAAIDLKYLVIRIEWGSNYGARGGLIPQFVPANGILELADIVLNPSPHVVQTPTQYRRVKRRN